MAELNIFVETIAKFRNSLGLTNNEVAEVIFKCNTEEQLKLVSDQMKEEFKHTFANTEIGNTSEKETFFKPESSVTAFVSPLNVRVKFINQNN
jgi:hypothetical protein